MEGNKNKILLTVIGAGTLLVALAGATFAYFSATGTTTKQTVTTAVLDLKIEADTTTNHITNIKPTSWDNDMTKNLENEDIAKVSFKVLSGSTTTGTYNIDMTAPGLALKTKGTDALGNEINLIGGSLADVKYKVYEYDGSSYTPLNVEGTLEEPEVAKAIITDREIVEEERFVIFVYIENRDDDQNQLQGLDFKISVTGSAEQDL